MFEDATMADFIPSREQEIINGKAGMIGSLIDQSSYRLGDRINSPDIKWTVQFNTSMPKEFATEDKTMDILRKAAEKHLRQDYPAHALEGLIVLPRGECDVDFSEVGVILTIRRRHFGLI